MPPRFTVELPGDQGAGVSGMQGIGVRTPMAAAVAAATVGFAMDLHIPNGRMFSIGMLSRMFAAGVVVNTQFTGSTTSEAGATPKEHCIMAPAQTCLPISRLLARKQGGRPLTPT
jgi:hypothetical protein